VVSTGNSLDCSPTDEPILKANEAAVKDMEGAAIAYTAQLMATPLIAIKSVTDIVDGEHPTRACPRPRPVSTIPLRASGRAVYILQPRSLC
jgi:hypothetical protein